MSYAISIFKHSCTFPGKHAKYLLEPHVSLTPPLWFYFRVTEDYKWKEYPPFIRPVPSPGDRKTGASSLLQLHSNREDWHLGYADTAYYNKGLPKMPGDHSLQKYLAPKVLGLSDVKTIKVQNQEGLVLHNTSQKHSGPKWTLARCHWCLILLPLHKHPSAGGLLQHLAFTHLPNFWVTLWKCVLSDCTLNTPGRGVIVDFPWGVWHFTIKMCKTHITPSLSASGHGSLW